MKRAVLAVTVACLLLPLAAQAKFTLGDDGGPNLSISGQLKFVAETQTFYLDYEGEPLESEPAFSFYHSAASLFLTGNTWSWLEYMFHHSFVMGRYQLYECYVKVKQADNYSVTLGQSKAPFGRVYNSSGSKLMFKGRNQITRFSPKYQIGVAPGLNLFDSKVALNAGVFNGKGKNVPLNTDPNVMVAADLTIAPFGPVPMEESAHRGFGSPVFAVVPGIYVNTVQEVARVDTLGQPLEYADVTTTSYGACAALRFDYLVFDAGYYMKDVDDPRLDTVVSSTGFTVQAGYAVGGKLEPIARFTSIDPNSGNGNDEVTAIEAGFNYYFKSYNSRLGLNYLNESTSGTDATAKSVVKLYYQFLY